jgi:hypothetical protein
VPVVSALVVACLGAVLCYEAFGQAGIHLTDVLASGFGEGGTEGNGQSGFDGCLGGARSRFGFRTQARH